MASEDGWNPAWVGQEALEWVIVPGTDVRLQLMRGWPLVIMRAFAADFHAYVEPLRDYDSAAYTPTNSVSTSNHLNGTAMDLNWNSHPFRIRGTFTDAQMATIRELLAFYEDTIYWAGDWQDPIDEMHWQMGYQTFNNPAVGDFIRRKIRSDGFSTFRRSSGPDAAQILSQAMGGRLPLDRYRELLPAVSEALRACECTSVLRIAMWLAQIGHESGGLYYTEEIASGAAYEGRADLGNTQPGDGVRFKGRSWIQITGRLNYTRLSQWAFDKGLVGHSDYFVQEPYKLAQDEYAGLGAAWYWVVARPDTNQAADRRDLDRVTRYINGGISGIEDRRARYSRALSMGDQLLTLISAPGGDFMPALSDDEQRELLDLARQQAKIRRQSRSPLRWPGEGEVDTCAGFAWAADANVHVLLVERLAVSYGDKQSIALLWAVANTDLEDRQADAELARRILAKVSPEFIAAAHAEIEAVSK